MSADVNVIIFNPDHLTVEEVAEYSNGYDIGALLDLPAEVREETLDRFESLHSKVYMDQKLTNGSIKMLHLEDNCFIGEASMLKATPDDPNKYIPSVVSHFMDVYAQSGGVILITEPVIVELLAGFDLPSNSIYETDKNHVGVASKERVSEFLHHNLGAWTFVDTW